MQMLMILDKLNIIDEEMWSKTVHSLKKVLHQCRDFDIPTIMDILDRNDKVDIGIFKKLVGLIPANFNVFRKDQMLRVYDILVKHRLGTAYLFDHYFYLYFEKHPERLTDSEYISVFEKLIMRGYFVFE